MRRRAFTLVELLVVITIIGILVALTIPAVTAVRVRARIAAINVELNQLDMACKSFKERFGKYPPDFADEDRAIAAEQVRRFIAKAFPRCRRLPADFQAADLPPEYNAGSALIFWLGGNTDATGTYIGFSADPANPFDVDASGLPLATKSTSRIKPFFDFNRTKITTPTGSLPTYWPGGVVINAADYLAGFVYFRAENKDYTGKTFMAASGRTALRDGRVSGTPWASPSSFQIRCCGIDGKMWNMSDTSVWGTLFGEVQDDPPFREENYNDQVNFASGTLEDNQP